MTDVYRKGTYQSVSEKTHPQAIRGDRWTALRWVDAAGAANLSLSVVEEAAQDVDYAIALDPQATPNLIWHRVERYPFIPDDNGTHWQGPIRTVPGERTHLTGHAMDSQNGKLGRGYGVHVKVSKAATVSTFILKLDPR